MTRPKGSVALIAEMDFVCELRPDGRWHVYKDRDGRARPATASDVQRALDGDLWNMSQPVSEGDGDLLGRASEFVRRASAAGSPDVPRRAAAGCEFCRQPLGSWHARDCAHFLPGAEAVLVSHLPEEAREGPRPADAAANRDLLAVEDRTAPTADLEAGEEVFDAPGGPKVVRLDEHRPGPTIKTSMEQSADWMTAKIEIPREAAVKAGVPLNLVMMRGVMEEVLVGLGLLPGPQAHNPQTRLVAIGALCFIAGILVGMSL